MTEALKLTIDRRDALAVIQTEGYINNQGGEEIARAAYELLESGYTRLLLDLTGTKIINSIGISILSSRRRTPSIGARNSHLGSTSAWA